MSLIPYLPLANPFNRYSIEAPSTAWADAERQIDKATRTGGASSMTVAVATGEKKRKAGEAVSEALAEVDKGKEAREGGKKKKFKGGRK
jgi:N-acetyltransferase 10